MARNPPKVVEDIKKDGETFWYSQENGQLFQKENFKDGKLIEP